jgi:FkbM family methyltransferase
LSNKEFLAQCSQNAAANAPLFSDEGLEAWIWNSCEKRAAVDDRFEKPFQRERCDIIPYREEDFPKNVDAHFHEIYSSLRRLARRGYRPDFVLDVGASAGVWSAMAQRLFPQARFILVEPLATLYSPWISYEYPQFEWVLAAASNKNGKTTIQVTSDLSRSSLLPTEGEERCEFIEVPVVTLDTVLERKAICGRGILKADVQYADHLVLEGAHQLLKKVDMIILELTLRNVPPRAKTFLEMLHQMELLGFDYFDDVGEWRDPMSGTLAQKDVLFVNRKLILEKRV